MKTLIFVPIVLSLVVLGAHFWRAGIYVGVIAAVLLIGLLFLRRGWVARLIQAVLVFGAIEWVRTVFVIGQLRVAEGQPFLRLIIILGVVIIVTAGSALLFETRTMRRIYRLSDADGTQA